MGFLDKAKQMAEQAQQKLDETQKQFNQGQAGRAGGGADGGVRYDSNGRPISTDPATDPVAAQGVGQPQPPAAAEPIEDQPGGPVAGAPQEPAAGQPAVEQPVEPPPVKDGVNSSPDPFKPIQ